MNKSELINRCLKFEDAAETYPFKDKIYEEYAVLRHKSNGKWFGLVSLRPSANPLNPL